MEDTRGLLGFLGISAKEMKDSKRATAKAQHGIATIVVFAVLYIVLRYCLTDEAVLRDPFWSWGPIIVAGLVSGYVFVILQFKERRISNEED